MEFLDILEEAKVYPGEYLLHKPTSEIVICGAYKKSEGLIRFLAGGRLKEDKLENFQKLKLTKKERKRRQGRGCGGCKRR
jgi:hypothetical protein|tara:strand:- start:1088 stop:1327 length:240 start_codon:yes stop_codon:yes gene_type:complete